MLLGIIATSFPHALPLVGVASEAFLLLCAVGHPLLWPTLSTHPTSPLVACPPLLRRALALGCVCRHLLSLLQLIVAVGSLLGTGGGDGGTAASSSNNNNSNNGGGGCSFGGGQRPGSPEPREHEPFLPGSEIHALSELVKGRLDRASPKLARLADSDGSLWRSPGGTLGGGGSGASAERARSTSVGVWDTLSGARGASSSTAKGGGGKGGGKDGGSDDGSGSAVAEKEAEAATVGRLRSARSGLAGSTSSHASSRSSSRGSSRGITTSASRGSGGSAGRGKPLAPGGRRAAARPLSPMLREDDDGEEGKEEEDEGAAGVDVDTDSDERSVSPVRPNLKNMRLSRLSSRPEDQ